MSDRDDINQNEGKKKVLRELSEAIRSPVFQEKVRRNVAGEKARFAYEDKDTEAFSKANRGVFCYFAI